MRQSRLGSLVESLINILIGYTISVTSTQIIFPLYGYPVTLSDNLWIGAWFTVISVVRSYVIRRYFEGRLHRLSQRIAGDA